MPLKNGFTLIEVLVVVTILGLLVALALPAYQSYTVRTAAADAITVVAGLQDDVAAYWTDNVAMPTDAELGRTPTDTQSKNISQVAVVTGGEIVVTFGNEAPGPLLATVQTFTPYTSADGTMSWQCGTDAMPAALTAHGDLATVPTIPTEYAPSSCK